MSAHERKMSEGAALLTPMNEVHDKVHAPRDTFLFSYMIFVLLGIGGLFPWNAFLTAYDFFSQMFPNFPFQFIMSIVFNIATVIFQFLGVGFGNRIPLTVRMLWTFIPFVVVMVLMPFVGDFVASETGRLGITLAFVFISGMSTAIGFNCVIGLASLFPPEYVGAVMLGQGVAGVLVGLIRIATKAGYGVSPEGTLAATLIYFVLAAFLELLCIVGYFLLLLMPFARYHMSKDTATPGEGSESKLSISEKDDDTAALLGGLTTKPTVGGVLKKIWVFGVTVWSVFFITLSLFPGMTSVIASHPNEFPWNAEWFAICNIFLFQVFDFVGRMLPRWIIIIPRRILWIVAFSRVIFGVLFILCIVPRDSPIFNSNWASFVIMIVFAITNGYTGTLAMMFAPDVVPDREKSLAGMIMSVFLQLGIFMAVLFALFILYLVQPCDLPGFLQTGSVISMCANHTTVVPPNTTAAFWLFQ